MTLIHCTCTCIDILITAAEVVNTIKASKDVQALCLEGNTIGVDAAKAIGEALSTRKEFEVSCQGSFSYTV